ncbi:MAG: CPBP family intramembrane metalloprotease [Chloroflexi bacterium]|nr:CPBP family intramembrane metalloprotease [Chloroflexota bacterium]
MHAPLTRSDNLRHFLWTMTLSPLIRVLSITLPLSSYPFILWYFIISVPLFASTFVVIRTIGLTRRDLMLEMNNLPIQFMIMLPGPLLGLFEYLILKPRPLAASLALNDLLGPALVLLVSTGFSEELIFRGLMQYTTAQLIPRWWAAVYVNLVFAVLHSGYLSFLDILFVFVVGMFFSWFSIRTKSLLGVTVAHGLVNIFLFLIVPFVDVAPGPTP